VAAVVGVGGLVLGLVAGCGDDSASRAAELRPRGATETASATVPSDREPTPDASSPGEQGSDEPGSNGTGNGASPEPSAEDLALPADFKVVYQARGADGAAGEAVREFGRFWHAWWLAVATGGRDTRYRAYLAPGSFAGGTGLITEVVDGWRRTGQRPTGTIRAHAVRAVPGDEGRVYLEGCGDETKAGAKDIRTGKVDWSFGKSETSRYKFRVALARTGDGWQIHEYLPIPATEPAGRECRG